MHIIHVATELAPIAKVGGLADVLYGLSKQLVRQNQQVEIILPKYDSIDYTQLKHLKVEMREVPCVEGKELIHNTIWSGELHGLRVLFLEPHHPEAYFSRGNVYACKDDIQRFTYFCKAALEYLFKARISPDIVHLHDWPTALFAPLYKELYQPAGLKIGGITLTIHNLEHQGKCLPEEVARLGLPLSNPEIRSKLQDPVEPGTVNIFKGGIEYADFVTTVSPSYEKEIKTKAGGAALDSLLIQHEQKLKGILNGIDEDFWNPENDPLLIKRYFTHGITTPLQLKYIFDAKAENRKQVRTHFGLKEENTPLVCAITRLATQKGPELLLYALKKLLKKGAQFVLLGTGHDSAIENEFLTWNRKDHRVGITIERDEALAHLLFAAADMILIPSRFEPCGLTQLIALRYGAIPIVRRTGGLADTIFDIDTSDQPLEKRNGFTFDFFDTGGIDWALDRALTCWQRDHHKWEQILLNGMRQDFSWKKPAEEYLAIYTELLTRAQAA
jgi:starch synthase